MKYQVSVATLDSTPGKLRDRREGTVLQSLLRPDAGSAGPRWLPLLLVFGSITAVAYADHIAFSVSLGYLYILPLGVGAMLLRSEISYGLILVCAFLHDLFALPYVNWANRIAHNLSAMLAFTFVVYIIQRYMKQGEQLTKSIRQQRDNLVRDVELAAEVQRMFLPLGKPTIAGLEIAGMMHPARGIGGDYYDYIPIDEHSIQLVIADVAGKGVAAALLMSATAAAVQLEVDERRDMLQVVSRLNTSIHAVSSDGERYVTLVMAEVDAKNRKLQYVNCGHNPALLFRAGAGDVTRMNSSCAPVGMILGEPCELVSVDLFPGDVLVFYTDGVTEAENRLTEEFGTQRLSAVVQRGSLLSAEDLMTEIYDAAADFCADKFSDDVTILVVKCDFDGSPTPASLIDSTKNPLQSAEVIG
jgi:serine phosphatase RsbU (regulator of sigma subunit)